jgi:vancomycin resistance protein VanJ
MNEVKRKRWSRRVTIAAWVSLGLTTALWLLLFRGDTWWGSSLFLFGPRWVVAPPLALIVACALVVRAWRAVAILVFTGLIVAGPITGGTVSPRTWWQDDEGDRLRVLTCNVDDTALETQSFTRLLAEARPDVVVLQESADPKSDNLFPANWHESVGPAGLRLGSRFPIKAAEYLRADSLGASGGVGRYRLDTPLGELTVVNVHLPTPRDGFELFVHGRWEGFRVTEELIHTRDRASAMTRAWLGELGPAVIVAGDFNMPVESAIYRRHWSDLGNSFSEAGWGWGFTKQTRWFGVRIDHVLHGKAWECRRVWLGPDVGSDHRPLIVDLVPTRLD